MEQYIVTGMTCAACQAHVEKAVSGVPGVDRVNVSLLTHSMTVEGAATPESVISAVQNAGYDAELKKESAGQGRPGMTERFQAEEDALRDRETPKLLRRLKLSIGVLLVLMYITMGHNMLNWPVPEFLNHNHIGLGILQMLLALIIMTINRDFFRSGFKSLRHGAPNMDTLVALGSGVSFLWSLFILLKMTYMVTGGTDNMALMPLYHNQLYFESAAMILALITIGKTLESISKGRTTDALKNLLQMAPKTALLEGNGELQEVPVDSVQIGDIYIVKSGDAIPVDGVVLEGTGAVDEAALTGESIPANNRLFDTLDTTTRRLRLDETQEVLLSDTVGFIRKLPTHLIEAFKATLEELKYADVLLHVIDISNPEWEEQARVVDDLIRQLGAESTPCIRVYNKCDAYFGILPHGEDVVCLSAKSGEGADALVKKLAGMLGQAKRRVMLSIPYAKAGVVDALKREANVLSMEYTDEGIKAEAVLTPALLGRVKEFIPDYKEEKEEWEDD